MADQQGEVGGAGGSGPLAGVVVAIGASAGGLEPLEKLLGNAPADAGNAYVVVQHLERHHPSLLTEILTRFTTMPVRQVTEGDRLEPGTVWVIPPNTLLTVREGVLHLSRPPENGPRMPIDTFFRSLALERGELAVGVLLSGADGDGTLGLRAIKENAGLTLAQLPETAKHATMPQSAIEAGFVDEALPVEAIPDRLLLHFRALGERVSVATQEAEVREALPKICEVLRRTTGHDFSRYKEGTLIRRVRRRIQLHRMPAVADYMSRLEGDAAEPGLLLRDLLIGVTQFFRDAAAFETLSEQVLARILSDADGERPVRVWVPGCATGEEAYSIAMLLHEQAAAAGRKLAAQVFATDIDEQALATARAARYPEEIAEHVGAERLRRYFTREDSGYQVVQEVRETCVFSAHNLIRDPPFSNLDLVSCRNLLIYLEPELQKRVIPLFHYALSRSGFLFLGPSEELAGHTELFAAVEKKHRVFQRRDTVVRSPLDLPVSGPRGFRGLGGGAAAEPSSRSTKQVVNQAFERMILEELAPASAVVDERGEILCIGGRFGELFQPRPGVLTTNLLDYATGTLRHVLRTALHEASQKGATVRQETAVLIDGAPRHLRLTVRPAPGVPPQSGIHAVIVEDLGTSTGAASIVSAEPMIEQLEDELKTTSATLQSAVEELESTNEELKSANEELMSTNEELQSANEELQTSKAELQSVNDELEEKQRLLEDIIDGSPSLIFLKDPSGRYLTVNRRLAAAVGRSSEELRGKTDFDILPRELAEKNRERVRRVVESGEPMDSEEVLDFGSGPVTYMATRFPLYDPAGKIYGICTLLRDISERRRMEAALAATHRRIAGLLESITDAFYSVDESWRFTYVNRRAAALSGMRVEELIGKNIWDVFPLAAREEPAENLRRAMETRTETQFEMRSARLDRWLSVSLYPWEDGLSVFMQDITFRKLSEDALREADRRKTEFLAILSHELRNPLAPIKNSLGILDRVAPGSDQAKRALDVISRQVGQLSHLVDDLLDVTRVSQNKVQLQKQRIELGGLVRRAVEDHQSLFDKGEIRVELHIGASPLYVNADPTRISQVIGNLLQNAAKFTRGGGRTQVTLSRSREGDRAVIRVTDTGAGMSKETVSRLFQPFMQADATLDRSQGGLGLGLALVKGLVELHGGDVQAESAGLGRGTEVTVRLPLDEQQGPGVDMSERESARGKFRVLIIEDNVDGADTLRDVMELIGHDVGVAYDGPSGLEAARKQRPDVVLCDIGLPQMDGYEVARAFRADASLNGIVLVALTGYARPEDVQMATEAGFDRHLSKPPSLQKLEQMLASIRKEP